ncbi:MAG: DNA polymerase III subunit delta [Clostridia bacterium]|nr:DNA polymerase III subunit delta [Clostridia bacterium]
MTVDALKRQLKDTNLSALYYLCGDEQYLLDYYYGQFKKICADVLPEFNFIELDGKKIDYDFLADAATSYPVMAERKLVAIMDLDTSGLKGNNEKKLAAALSDIAPGVTVLFIDHAKEGGKTNALDSALKKLGGETVRVDRPKPEKLQVWVQELASKSNCEISGSDAAYLVELTGGSMLALKNELHKICAFLQAGEIDRNLIDKMVSPTEDASWFAISGAISEHDFEALMDALKLLYQQNVDDTVIAGMFYRAYTDLWRGETALKEGKSSAELAAVCGISPYAAARIMRSASKLMEGEALDGLRKCRELDQKIKTSGLNKKDLIYSFAAGLLAFQMKDHE